MIIKTPWYYGWNIVAAGMISQAVIFGIYIYSFTLWIEPWTKDFGIGRSDAMMVFFTVQVANALFAPIAGQALDKFPIRYLMLFAAVSFSAALALSTFVTSFWQIALIYGVLMVIGMAWAGTVTAATLVARWFGRRRGIAMGISTVGTSIGGLLLPPLVASFLQDFGWREANMILAMIAFATITLASLIVFDSPEKAGLVHEGQPAKQAESQKSQPTHEWTTKELLRSKVFWAVGISFLLLSFAITAVQQNLAPLGADAGIEQTELAWYISVMATVMIFAKLGIGYISDKLSHRTMLGLVTLLVAICLAILIGIGPGRTSLLAVAVVLGIGLGGMLPMLGVIVADNFGPASFGRIQGILILVMLPAALGPLVAARIYDSYGSYQMAWIALLILLIPTALCVRSIGNDKAASKAD